MNRRLALRVVGKMWITERDNNLGLRYQVGWCSQHESLARYWPDRGMSCFYQATLDHEDNSLHSVSDFVPLYRYLLHQ